MRTSAAIAPAFDREHRVQVHLGDFREIGDELRNVDDHRGERVAVDRLGAAHALQDLGRGDAVQHRQRVVLRRRREPERDVLQHLDQDAAQPERDQLAERGVGHGADDDLLAAAEHLLHLDAEQVSPCASYFVGVGHDRREALLRPRRALFTPTSTPPASVLCRICGETILSTTGKPIAAASFAASAADVATPSFGTGMPYASQTSLPSGAVSDVRPSAFTLVENAPDFGLVVRHRCDPSRRARQITFSARSAAISSLP